MEKFLLVGNVILCSLLWHTHFLCGCIKILLDVRDRLSWYARPPNLSWHLCHQTYNWQTAKKIKSNIWFPGAIIIHSSREHTLIATAMTLSWKLHKSPGPDCPMQSTWAVKHKSKRDICLHHCTITCWQKEYWQTHHVADIFPSLLEEMWVKWLIR